MITVKKSHMLLAGLGLVSLLLAGCMGQQLGNAKMAKSDGSAFDKALYSGYVELSQMEYDEGDYQDSDAFANRAMAAASGSPSAPESLEMRNVPAEHMDALTAAHRDLGAVISEGSTKFPKLAAMAQLSFDCWMQEQEENFQPDDIERCKSDFNYALDALKAAMVKPPVKARRYEKYTLLFALNSSKISKDEEKTLNKAVLSIDGSPATRIVVSGHADRSGAASYNMMLSMKRAEAVAALLNENSSAEIGNMVEIKAHGEEQNEVETPDGAYEPKNRRVKIDIIR